MIYGIYSSAGGMLVNQYRQEVLANNLANVSTAGFKPDVAVVRERQVESRESLVDPALSNALLDDMTGGSLVAPTFTSFEQGPVQPTGNPLDAAINGDGFFVVQDGTVQRYTRDGRFTINGDGQLVTVAGGKPVLDASGREIVIPRQASGRARIDSSGEVRVGDTVVGKLGVVGFDDPQLLRKVGANLLQATGGTKGRQVEANLAVASVEGSGVDPTQTMVSMIEVNRAYQLNATLVGLADSTLGRAVNDIARIQ